MAQREWVEKDFYKELGVAPDADQDEIKRVARKLLAENHPDRNPGNKSAEDRYKAASEAKEVLSDPTKRKEYDETRRLFANGGFWRGRVRGGGAGGGRGRVQSHRPVRRGRPDRRCQHRRPVRRPVRAWRPTAEADKAAARQRS